MSDSTTTASRSDRSRGASAFWTAFAILIILLLISFILVSIRLYDYVMVDDRELSVNTNSLAKSFCDGLVGIHIKKLIFE